MKLWAKIFLFTLVLFVVVTYFSIFYISCLSYENSLNTARRQAFSQHEIMSTDISENIKLVLERRDEQNFRQTLNALMNYYFGYYEKRGIYLNIEKQGDILSGNIPQAYQPEELQDVSDSRKLVVKTIDQQKYIFVSAVILEDFVLVYAQDITDLTNSQNRLTRQLQLVTVFASLLFSIALFLIIKRLTRPIIRLQDIAKRITSGELAIRAQIKGKDEISNLALSFNEMADEIVAKMTESEQNAIQKQKFIDNLAHELNTPLTAIKGHADLLQNAKTTEKERINSTFHIIQNVDRIQKMSQKLLDLALNRNLTISQNPILLGDLFDAVKDEFDSVLRDQNINLSISGKDETVYGDFVLLQNLVSNMIENSIRATQRGGSIYLNAHKDDEHITIEIIDNGVGIAKKDLENIFEPFYRTDFSRSNYHKNDTEKMPLTEPVKKSTPNSFVDKNHAGLGLALCKQIADIHEAKIEIQSKQGKGTTIKIIFDKKGKRYL